MLALLKHFVLQLLSKKDDIEDHNNSKYTSQYSCSRDNNKKIQPTIISSSLGEILKIL